MRVIIETVYLTDYDNSIRLRVEADGAAIDEAVVTRTQLRLASSTSGTPLVLDTGTPEHAGLMTWQAGGVLSLTLGGAPGLTAGKWSGRLVVFDPQHGDGLVWGDVIQLNVIQL